MIPERDSVQPFEWRVYTIMMFVASYDVKHGHKL